MNTIGIVGLGLIGGSMAKAIKNTDGYQIFAYDIATDIVEKALEEKVIKGSLNEDNIGECQILMIALYPKETINYVKKNSHLIKKDGLVIDCSGVKRQICQELETIAEEEGFHFIGGHPMAGIEFSGYDYSRADLFKDASMILCTGKKRGEALGLTDFFKKIGFGELVFTTAEEHDKLIAYTSQLAHVVSNAFVKSKAAERHKGFSAGSYWDLTRVARLNPSMWTELFLCNRDFLSKEIGELIENLQLYKDALTKNQKDQLYKLLDEGRKRKEKIDY